MNNIWGKTVTGIAGLLVLIYIGYQIYSVSYRTVKTEFAVAYTHYDTVETEGFVVRDETVLDRRSEGIVSYNVDNGGRVSAGGVVARVYANAEQADAAAKIIEIDQTIASLEELGVSDTLYTTDTDLLDNQINEQLGYYLNTVQSGNLKSLDTVSKELLRLLNRRSIAIGGQNDFSLRIQDLQSHRVVHEAKAGSPVSSIVSDYSGYFVNESDGYEDCFLVEELETMTPETFVAAKKQKATVAHISGKIVTDYDWYFVSVIDSERASSLKKGDNLTVALSLSTVNELPVTVMAVNKSVDSSQCLLVLSCNYMNSELSRIRSEPISIRLKIHSGLRVSNSSIRVVDGAKGVYILSGIVAKFIPIDVLYADKGYVMCSSKISDSNKLSLYDEVIMEGNDLYDGKVVQ